MKSGNEIGNLLRNADVLATCEALIPLVGVMFFGVIMCHCLGGPLVWQEGVQLAFIVQVVFLGDRYASICGNHTTIDVIVEMFLEKLQKLLSVLIAAATVIILCYVGYQGARYIMQMVHYDRVIDILKIPYSLVCASLPIGCLTTAAQVCLNAYRDLAGEGREV